MNLQVHIDNADSGDDHPPPAAIERWVRAALAGRRDSAELSIRIVDEAEITALNSRYRHQDKATNVLSFPADLPPDIALPLLGDIVICAPVVAREAHQQNKTAEAHWAHMVVHGTLHLLGFDHIEEQEAETMERLESAILEQLHFPNPYLSPAQIQ